MIPGAWLDLCNAHLGHGVMRRRVDSVEARVKCREESVLVLPKPDLRYLALELVHPDDCRVIILGQDPYHNVVRLQNGEVRSQATGLAFSVPFGVRPPPSLVNIYKEIKADLGLLPSSHGNLESWAAQGVLLLNSILSVEKDRPKSHEKMGWHEVTSGLIESLSAQKHGLVFILWGNDARSMKRFIRDNGHVVIESSHPSPIGGSCYRGFFGSRPFSRANEALVSVGKRPIDWRIPECDLFG